MPKIKSALNLIREFSSSNLPGCSKKDPLIIKIRQASEGERMNRESMLLLPVERQVDEDGFYKEQQAQPGMRFRIAVEVYLTLAACNIENGNGDPIFEFDKAGHISSTFGEFLRAWGLIPYNAWVDWIHERILEVNPTWIPRRSNEPEPPEIYEDGQPEGEEQPASDAG